MLHIRILSIGRVKQHFIREGEQEFLKRIRPWAQLTVEELSETSGGAALHQRKATEAQALLSAFEKGPGVLLSLDERGRTFSSEEFARYIEDLTVDGHSRLTFAIGGAFGLGEEVLQRSHELISLSRLTFPRQLCRLILVEQLYRALSILRGSPYHKE